VSEGVTAGSGGSDFRRAIDALDPLLFAERQRGNSSRLEFGDMHDQRLYYSLRHPIDLDALRAQFDFGDGIELGGDGQGGVVAFSDLGPVSAFWMRGTTEVSWWSRRRRAAWWRRWNASPRERIPFSNPFAGMPG
jgi:hypothetical protein